MPSLASMRSTFVRYLAPLSGAALLLLAACSPSEEQNESPAPDSSKNPSSAESETSAKGDTEQSLAFGRITGMMFRIHQLGLTPAEVDRVGKEFVQYVTTQKTVAMEDAEKIQAAQQYFGTRMQTKDRSPVETENLQNFAVMIAVMSTASELSLSTAEAQAFAQGLTQVAVKPLGPDDFNAQQETVAPWIVNRIPPPPGPSEETLAAADKFFAELDARDDVVKAHNGLRYTIEKPGEGKKPALKNTVVVNYTGKLIDGTVFDSSVNRGTPATFPLEGVISGFAQGLMLLKPGGKATLYLPAEIAYGNQPPPGSPIQRGDPLIFEVELIAIQ